MSRGALLRWFAGLAVSAVFLWLAFRAVNPGEIWQEIAGADQRYLIPATACTTLTQVLRGIRWKLCFEKADRVTFLQSNAAYGVGALAGQTVVPGRLGDLVRVWVLRQVSAASASKALGTLVVERLSDMFAVVLMLSLLLPLFSLPGWIKLIDAFAAAIAVVALVVVYLMARRSETLRQPGWVAGRRPFEVAFRILLQIVRGFSAVRDPRRAALILLASAGLWLSQTGTYAISFASVRIPLGWKEGALTTGVLALTAIIPTGPGFAGSFELATQQLLALFNVDRTLATGYQEYTRIVNLIASVVVCVVFLIGLKLWPGQEAPEPSDAQVAPVPQT